MLFHMTPFLYLTRPRDGERNQIAQRLRSEGCFASRCWSMSSHRPIAIASDEDRASIHPLQGAGEAGMDQQLPSPKEKTKCRRAEASGCFPALRGAGWQGCACVPGNPRPIAHSGRRSARFWGCSCPGQTIGIKMFSAQLWAGEKMTVNRICRLHHTCLAVFASVKGFAPSHGV